MSESTGMAVTTSHLRKEYIIHTRQATTLKEMVIKNLFDPSETVPYVALRDLSFELPKGRSLAIVGANGSGKSTLLKLISGISDPTSGTLKIDGRIAALLELGAGFQPEFTGMENIFLQCSILGLHREEILAKLDQIIAFSDLEKFIHTPVKRYSSGMYVRLGFAIAAHVDADILLLDEVLAVGDQAFQTKCIRKIQELHEGGRTIVFVSHVLDQIESVADLVLWLSHGDAVDFGNADEILPKFYESLQGGDTSGSSEVHMDERALAALPTGRFAAKSARIKDVRFLDDAEAEARAFSVEQTIRIRVVFEIIEPLNDIEVHIGVGTMASLRAGYWGSGGEFTGLGPGSYVCDMTLDEHFLPPGRYLFSIMLGRPGNINHTYDIHLRMYAISIHERGTPASFAPGAGMLMPWGEFAAASH
ncbi:MAG: ABC transporter ATP-binding protein [Candidatus Sumerlaeota bacterium]